MVPFYSVERVVSIYNSSGKPAQYGTVFIRFSPTFGPSVYLVYDKKFSNAHFVNLGKSAPKVSGAADILGKAIDSKLPTSKWVSDFDFNFEISDRTIYKKQIPASTLGQG